MTGQEPGDAARQDELRERLNRLNTGVAHSARVYDYWLGGKDNFAADREAAEQVIAVRPTIRADVRANRAFLGRAVRYLAAEAGIRQFLDIGTGLPSADNTHEVAQSVAPEARVVYADNDPIVLAHARALLTSAPEGRHRLRRRRPARHRAGAGGGPPDARPGPAGRRHADRDPAPHPRCRRPVRDRGPAGRRGGARQLPGPEPPGVGRRRRGGGGGGAPVQRPGAGRPAAPLARGGDPVLQRAGPAGAGRGADHPVAAGQRRPTPPRCRCGPGPPASPSRPGSPAGRRGRRPAGRRPAGSGRVRRVSRRPGELRSGGSTRPPAG